MCTCTVLQILQSLKTNYLNIKLIRIKSNTHNEYCTWNYYKYFIKYLNKRHTAMFNCNSTAGYNEHKQHYSGL